jgi:hypothetical protein
MSLRRLVRRGGNRCRDRWRFSAGAFLLVLFARRPETFLNPQLWAEDGPIFFVQADEFGARALTFSWAGYHHFLLRLIAAVSSPLNAQLVPAAYVGIAPRAFRADCCHAARGRARRGDRRRLDSMEHAHDVRPTPSHNRDALALRTPAGPALAGLRAPD